MGYNTSVIVMRREWADKLGYRLVHKSQKP